MWKNPAPGATAQPVRTVGRLWSQRSPCDRALTRKGPRFKERMCNGQVAACYNRSNQIQIRARANGGRGTHCMVIWIWSCDRGLGLSPSLEPRANGTQLKLKYILNHIYIKAHTVARRLAALPKSLPLPGGRGVESCRLQNL
jgi:hypothetical protein